MGHETIPDTINSHKLLKDLSKEVRIADRLIMTLNPPKPERESKRKKRKPVNKDFVDFSQPPPKIQYAAATVSAPPPIEPQPTIATAVHQGGTIMRFSLLQQPLPSMHNYQVTPTKNSVYDFEEANSQSSDEFSMVIDDLYKATPKRATKPTSTSTSTSKSFQRCLFYSDIKFC